MFPVARVLRCRLWLVAFCLLLAAGTASAGSRSVTADFDGDGQRDRAELDHREPTALRVRLSASQVTVTLRGALPFIGLAARDLDGDRRDELIVSDTSTRLHVWTKRHHGLEAVHQTHHSGLSAPSDCRLDQPAQRVPACGDPEAAAPLAARTPKTYVLVVTARRPPPADDRTPAAARGLAPFAPRPPPLTLQSHPARA